MKERQILELVCRQCGGRSCVVEDENFDIKPLGQFAVYDGKSITLPCGHSFDDADCGVIPEGVAAVGDEW